MFLGLKVSMLLTVICRRYKAINLRKVWMKDAEKQKTFLKLLEKKITDYVIIDKKKHILEITITVYLFGVLTNF